MFGFIDASDRQKGKIDGKNLIKFDSKSNEKKYRIFTKNKM